MRSRALLSRARAREDFRHTRTGEDFGRYITRVQWRAGRGWVAILDESAEGRHAAGFADYSRGRRLTRRAPVITMVESTDNF